jgi:hypothetical protein
VSGTSRLGGGVGNAHLGQQDHGSMLATTEPTPMKKLCIA